MKPAILAILLGAFTSARRVAHGLRYRQDQCRGRRRGDEADSDEPGDQALFDGFDSRVVSLGNSKIVQHVLRSFSQCDPGEPADRSTPLSLALGASNGGPPTITNTNDTGLQTLAWWPSHPDSSVH